MDRRRQPESDRLRVMVFGPGSDTKGGVSTFSELASRSALSGVSIRIVKTHADSPARHLANFLSAVYLACTVPREPDLVFHINIASGGSSFRKYWIGRIAHARGIPYVLNVHCGRFEAFFNGRSVSAQRRLSGLFNGSARVVVLGPDAASMFRDVVGVRDDLITVIPNGVPGPPDDPATRAHDPEVRIVYLGLISEAKGAFDLIEALARLRHVEGWRATVAGDGQLDEAKSLARERGIDERVDFTGWVDAGAVRRLLAESALFVLPSHSEGLPFSLLEAMAEGCAVIATPVGAIPDVIDDGSDGLLVEVGDIEALAATLERCITDRDLLERLGLQARHKWSHGYSDSAMIERLTAVWRSVVGVAGVDSAHETGRGSVP